ncbi:MAG: MATE family efflux transporter [Planctomycetes bacterium]|nr:MATE family efflux transporter [Planctomycetota bacterium]
MTENADLTSARPMDDETSLFYILRLAAPMMVTLISFTIMQFVDRYMVSHLGTSALAAIMPAGITAFVPASFALGVVATVSTFVSQCYGRGELRGCSNFCWQAIYLGLIYISFTTLILWPAAPKIFLIMGHESSVIEMEVVYFRIMLYVHFTAVIIWSCGNFYMGIHRPNILMYAAIVAHIVNVISNYILIFGKFGFPAMGIAGAAWGTFIGVSLEAAILLAVFVGPEMNKTYRSVRSMNVNFVRMKSLLKVGAPSGFSFMINIAFFGMILFGLVGRFGKEALAATGAALSCTNLSIMPIIGLKNALTATVGKSIGKNRKDIAIAQTNTCLRAALMYVIFMGACFIVFRHGLMRFWSTDTRVIEIGIRVFVFSAVFQLFDCIFHIYNGSLKGAGDTMWPAIISATCAIIVLGGGGFMIVRFLPGLGALGPWIAAIMNLAIAAFAMRWRFKSNHWMKIDLFKHDVTEVPSGAETVIK